MSHGSSNPTTVAFYLPQFHTIPENDAWWGVGFTEWFNVRKATPQFSRHQHPVVPTGELGYYDLRDTSVMEKQFETAKLNGVDAFCFYHYWFDGHRLLEAPLDAFIAGSADGTFCVCWANENWSRRWDGKEKEVLLAQNYGASTPEACFKSMLPYLKDERYLRLSGKAVLLVHRVDHLPDPKYYAAEWRRLAQENGLGDLWLVASETVPGLNPTSFGFDAVAEFPPVGDSTLSSVALHSPRELDRRFRGRLLDYGRLARSYMHRVNPAFPRHRGVVPRWDNTARRKNKATIFLNSTPDQYATWLTYARASERAQRGSEGLVFINAWNEWAEGAYLEEDAEWGNGYLMATRWDYVPGARSRQMTDHRPWPHVRSLALAAAASGKNLTRELRYGRPDASA